MGTSLNTQIRLDISQALSIVAPSQFDGDMIATMEAILRSLVLDTRHPVALELAGAAHKSRFIIRATTQAALDHVEALLRAEYPKIEIKPVREDEDAFRLDAHEAVSAVELITEEDEGAHASQRPSKEERDPLLGLLAVLSKLPEHTRAIVQIALSPVSSTMITARLGKTEKLSNPIHKGFLSSRRDVAAVLLINILLLGCLSLFAGPWLPGWLWGVLRDFILWGQFPALTVDQVQQLIWCTVAFILVEGLFLFGTVKVIQQLFPQVPDQVIPVAHVKSAYRTCMRLYVISTKLTKDTKKNSYSISKFSDNIGSQEKFREDIILRIIAAYRQFSYTNGINFIPQPISSEKAQLLLSREIGKPNHGWQQGLLRSDHLVSFHILATLWHLPLGNRLPELARQGVKTRTLPLPPEVVDQSRGLTPIGYSEYRGKRLPFSLTAQFFLHHTLIAGKSGVGKSAFMRHVACEAMVQGGLVLVDPYGDLCEDVLKFVPRDRAEDVILIDLTDRTASVGLNPLDVTLGRGRDKAISDLLKMLAHIWVSSWGAEMENTFEISLRTLFEANKSLVAQDAKHGPKQQYTLLDVSPLLTNIHFCQAVLQQVQDDYLHRWWHEYYEPLSFAQQREVLNPLITKVAKFESIGARRIIGQGASTLNFTQMIAERKIILVKLAQRSVGSEVASLVGATLLGLIELTLEAQGLKEQQKQVALPIIIDEFHMLSGTDYATLAKLHKYGATFFLAAQSLEYLQKLNPLLLPTIQANVKQLIAFSMSARDAEILHQELGVEPEEIIHLDMYSCYVALFAADRRQPTFSLKLVPPVSGDLLLAESIRTRCRARYTHPIDEIDEMLRAAMIRRLRQLPLSKEKEKMRAKEALALAEGAQSPTIAPPSKKKTRFVNNDTQLLPFTKELDTGELEVCFYEEYKSTTENSKYQDEEEHHHEVRSFSADKQETTEKLEVVEINVFREQIDEGLENNKKGE